MNWTERKTRDLVNVVGGMLLGIMLATCMQAAQATEGDPHQVVVCKYVGTPGVDEVLQTGQNPIVVDVAALEEGFDGTFPFEFEDAQGNSIAIRYAENAQDGSIEECPGYVTPTPTPTVTPSPSDSPSPTNTPSPSDSTSKPPTHSSTPTHTKTDTPTKDSPRRTALTGGDWALPGAAALVLGGLGGLAFWARRRFA
jgi:hypothetical protein